MPQFSGNEVKDWFKNFGVDATPEEVAMFTGVDYIGGGSAIGNYVATKKAQAERQANDPLKAVLAAQKSFGEAQAALASGDRDTAAKLYDQLFSTLQTAPKLFGNMTPEQVNTYLAPIKASVEGDSARRGLTGSSTEMNALTGNTLKAGLDVGLTLQDKQAAAIQSEINRRTQLVGTATGAQANALGLQGQAAGVLSQEGQQDQELLSSLPLYLRSYVAQALAADRAAQKQKKGILGVMSDISTGINLGGNILSMGALDRLLPTKPGGGGGGMGAPLASIGPTSPAADPSAIALL